MILGIDIGGSFTDMLLFDGKRFTAHKTFPTNMEILKNEIERSEAKAIGIAIAAWLREGKILHAPNLPFKEFDLKLNVPYIMENDANCFAYAASKIFNEKNLIGITIGTGIGMGIVVEEKIYHGNGIAGELGHIVIGGDEPCVCGGKGHLECYFSGWSIRKRYGREAKELFEKNEFPYDENFDVFCKAVANAILLFDPSIVAIGGRIGGRIDEKKLSKIYDFLPSQFKPKIKTIKDDYMVAKGAAYLAMDSLKNI